MLSKQELWSVVLTAAFGIIAAIGAVMSMQSHAVLGLAVSVGALGGLVHEIVQSGGKILFFQHREDGVYLGSIAGMALGTVAGVLVVRSQLPAVTGVDATPALMTELAYEIFLAGLALKGVSEAAGGNSLAPQAGRQQPAAPATVVSDITR
jgi:uncharacterized protein DUF4257